MSRSCRSRGKSSPKVLTAEDYEMVHVRFETTTVDELRSRAKADDRPISALVRYIVTRHLNAQEQHADARR